MSNIPISQLQCPVELFISCQGLKNTDLIGKSDPRVRVFMQQEDKKWHRIGSTEKIKNNLNPEFRTTIITDFVFEARQPLKFEVTDIDESSITDDYIGVAETTLGEIIAAPRQTMHLAVRSRSRDIVGTLIVRGDKNGQARNTIFFQWSGINLINFGGCFSKKTCPFLRFFKQKDREWFQVYATEVVQENMNPFWQMFKTTDDKLCGGAHNKLVKIECWDHKEDGKHKFIGATEITLEKLKNGENLFQLANPTKIKGTGSLKLVSFTLDPRPSFFDFIRGGEQLNSIVGIDYTASNNDELRKVNLHARLPDGQFNEYQQAIVQICEIIENYDRRKMIPVFGFGAIPKYENLSDWKVSHCFPCSGDVEKSQVQGVSGVLDVYRYALDNVKLAGPTNFAPIITEAMKVCQIHKKNDTDIYTTFLIITDGLIGDMNETINALMEAAYLPISIIIIGLGTADFSKMEILDGDKAIVNKAGEKCAREFVKFVPFGRFKNNMQELARHVLARIPEQLVEYKLLVGKKPKPVFYECSSNS